VVPSGGTVVVLWSSILQPIITDGDEEHSSFIGQDWLISVVLLLSSSIDLAVEVIELYLTPLKIKEKRPPMKFFSLLKIYSH